MPRGHGPPRRPVDDRFWRSTNTKQKPVRSGSRPILNSCARILTQRVLMGFRQSSSRVRLETTMLRVIEHVRAGRQVHLFRARGHATGLWATVERTSGAFLGRCGLLPWKIQGKREVELAFLIDKSRWGEGLVTEPAAAIVDYARAPLGLSRLICLITPGNAASVRAASKIGMAFEREHDDELGLCHIYARTLGKYADAVNAIC